jgi:hypothetical protein
MSSPHLSYIGPTTYHSNNRHLSPLGKAASPKTNFCRIFFLVGLHQQHLPVMTEMSMGKGSPAGKEMSECWIKFPPPE